MKGSHSLYLSSLIFFIQSLGLAPPSFGKRVVVLNDIWLYICISPTNSSGHGNAEFSNVL